MTDYEEIETPAFKIESPSARVSVTVEEKLSLPEYLSQNNLPSTHRLSNLSPGTTPNYQSTEKAEEDRG